MSCIFSTKKYNYIKSFSIVIISFLSLTSYSQKLDLSIPWFIKERINNDRESIYNYKDSLNNYEPYPENEINNLGNFYSFMSNLKFANNAPREEVMTLLNNSAKIDIVGFCDHLIYQTYDYLKPNGRPSRRYTMPFILDLDIEYFINKLKDCKLSKGKILTSEEELELRISYIMLKDQWYRIPDRKANPEKQIQFDEENRNDLNKLLKDFDFNKATDDLRNNIYTLLLHSTDCEWSNKWLNIYIKHFNDYNRYKDDLKHFLWRSSCQDVEILERINKELMIK